MDYFSVPRRLSLGISWLFWLLCPLGPFPTRFCIPISWGDQRSISWAPEGLFCYYFSSLASGCTLSSLQPKLLLTLMLTYPQSIIFCKSYISRASYKPHLPKTYIIKFSWHFTPLLSLNSPSSRYQCSWNLSQETFLSAVLGLYFPGNTSSDQ